MMPLVFLTTGQFQSYHAFQKSYRKLFITEYLTSLLDLILSMITREYGFRQKHCKWMAVLELVDQIFQAFENNDFTIGIFIDLKKTFDTVDLQILLEKLEFYGIRGIPQTWIKSYLSNRQQFVNINNCKSSYKKISCGVHQVSVLGPLLFLIYINDIFNCSNHIAFILFADDTNIFAKHKDVKHLMDMINIELKHVASWLAANKLTLHPNETKFILFHPTRKKINLHDINLHINGINIDS